MLRILLNVLWLVVGGLEMAVGWWLAALVFAITLIGLPWARSAFTIGVYTLWPFGSQAVRRDRLTGQEDLATGPLGLLGNLIWFLVAGWWLALGHILIALIWAVTVIGLPFAVIHLKLVPITLFPVGMMVIASQPNVGPGRPGG